MKTRFEFTDSEYSIGGIAEEFCVNFWGLLGEKPVFWRVLFCRAVDSANDPLCAVRDGCHNVIVTARGKGRFMFRKEDERGRGERNGEIFGMMQSKTHIVQNAR